MDAVGVTDYSNILKLAKLYLTFAVANSESETGFSHMKRIENSTRSQVVKEPLSFLMRTVLNKKPYGEHDSIKAVEVFLQQKNVRKIT